MLISFKNLNFNTIVFFPAKMVNKFIIIIIFVRRTTGFTRRRLIFAWSSYFSAKQRYICTENDGICMQQLSSTEKARICTGKLDFHGAAADFRGETRHL